MKRLDLQEFDQIVKEFKEDLQGEANRYVLKHDVHAAAAALMGIDAVDRLSHRVTARAFSLGERPELEETPPKRPASARKAPRLKNVREFSKQKVG